MTPNRYVAFEVVGVPKPQGSARAFTIGGKARLTNTTSRAASEWRDAVATTAKQHADMIGPLDAACVVTIEFRHPMPKSRTKRVRDRGTFPKVTAPDIDKLARSVLDGMQAGGLIVDDSIVFELHCTKHEIADGWTGARVEVQEIEP